MTDHPLLKGIGQARASGASWVRVAYSIACRDPWDLVHVLSAQRTRVMAWSAPGSTPSQSAFIAVGATIELRPAGTERFNEAGVWWSEMGSQITDLDGQTGELIDIQAPACLAGFAFAHSPSRSLQWEQWGDGALCVPEILIWRSGESTQLVLCTQIDEHTVDVLQERQATVQAWLQQVRPCPQPSSANLQVIGTSDTAWDGWRDKVQAACTEMATGTMDKVVLARAQSYRAADGTQFDPASTAMALRERQSESTTFLVQRSDGQAFLGSTPEILVRLDGQAVQTVAMAGTRKRGEGEETEALGEALLASPKDRHEQALVTEALRTALAPVVTDLQVPAQPEVVQLTDVQHLRTRICGHLNGETDIFDLLQRLHPTPAVGGLPRQEALTWLDDHEALDRGWYAGPIGWINRSGDGEFVVAIRSALMTDSEAAAFAGCGVVMHSNPRDEWDESVVKLQTVRSGLALRGWAET